MDPKRITYRVTIRHQSQLQQYEVFEVEAANLRDALLEVTARFPEQLTETSDLVEVRPANPSG
jgi:hypothetical protein